MALIDGAVSFFEIAPYLFEALVRELTQSQLIRQRLVLPYFEHIFQIRLLLHHSSARACSLHLFAHLPLLAARFGLHALMALQAEPRGNQPRQVLMPARSATFLDLNPVLIFHYPKLLNSRQPDIRPDRMIPASHFYRGR